MRPPLMMGGVCVFLFAVAGCVEPLPIWKKLDEAPLPVTVNALITGNRGMLSRHRALTYEGWRVSFGPAAPTAAMNTLCSWRVNCDIEIKSLRCAAMRGQAGAEGPAEECTLSLDTLDEVCELRFAAHPDKIGIPCPVDIVLDKREPLSNKTSSTASTR